MTESFEFSLIASGLDPRAEDFDARFYDAGCDDATVSFQKGHIIVDFARRAESFEAAVIGAMADVERAGARVEHLEPDTLVNLADIAKRVGLTRAAIHNYATGERGEGFPPPVARVTTEMALYDWAAVSAWLHGRGAVDAEVSARARFVRRVNDDLERVRRAGRGRRSA